MFRLRSYLISDLIVILTLAWPAIAQQLSDQEIENKINALLPQMTIEEKAGQLTQFPDNSPKTLQMTREGKVGSLLGVLGVKDTNAAQKVALESRLKIPLIFGYDVIHGYRTIFSVPIAAASSFDMATIEQAERCNACFCLIHGDTLRTSAQCSCVVRITRKTNTLDILTGNEFS